MKLNYVVIKNFRSIKDIKITFDPRCRTLVGINESGKTNVLKALSFLSDDFVPDKDDLRQFGTDEDINSEAYVRFVFDITDSERLKIKQEFIKRILAKPDKDHIIKIHGKQMTINGFVDFKSQLLYTANIINKNKIFQMWSLPGNSEIVGEWKEVKKDTASVTTTSTTHNGTDLSKYSIAIGTELPDRLDGLVFKTLTAAQLNTIYTGVAADILKESLPDCIFWTYEDKNLLPAQINIEEFSGDPDTCIPLKKMFALAGIASINEEIEKAQGRSGGFRNLLIRVSKAATQHMHQVWEEYKDIKIELIPNGDYIDAYIFDAQNTYNFSRRSDGFKRFITFLLLVSASAKTNDLQNTLYLHDEPEASLHPSGIKHLRDELIKISENNYVVFSTHSTFMIDRNYIDRHIIVKKENEITDIAIADTSNISDEEVLYNALDTSIFENLAKNNIVFEGWRDKRLFQVCIKSTKVPSASKTAFKKVGTCHAKGVKDINRVTAMLELANRDCLIISDNDNPAKEKKKSYDGYGTWYLYSDILPSCRAKTGEDFVKPKLFKPALEAIAKAYPSLLPFDTEKLNIDRGRLDVIGTWLETGGFTADEKKDILNKIKSDVFGNLKTEHIEDSYFDWLKELALKLPD